jgi:hypothetical protein
MITPEIQAPSALVTKCAIYFAVAFICRLVQNQRQNALWACHVRDLAGLKFSGNEEKAHGELPPTAE